MKNPFISRGPVREGPMFFGRHHELREIAAFLHGNQSVSIVGPRKIGKTSLLFHLMRPTTWAQIGLTADYLFVYLDCEVLGEGSHEEIFGQFAGEMVAALEERQLPPEPTLNKALEKPSRLAFVTAIRRLNQRGLRVVLILDEFERLSTNPSLDVNFFNALRAAASQHQLIFLTASASPLIQLTYSGKSREILSSPFFNIFAQHYLGLFPGDEILSLIDTLSLAANRNIPSKTIGFIQRLAGGHPLCLQVACFHAFETPDNLENIRQRTMREMDGNFTYAWQNLTQVEQETLSNLPTVLTQLSKDTSIVNVLRELAQKCMLVIENGLYRYAYKAWEDFIRIQVDTSQKTVPSLSLGSFRDTHLGPYQIQELIARGGMAEVYKGIHTRLQRPVAIKVLPLQLATEDNTRRRFEREARAVAALKHPNIVQVFDFGEFKNTYYLVMEYVNGKDLRDYMNEHPGPMTLEDVLPILRDLANALDYAHQQGVIHRDVKPSNILLEVLASSEPSKPPYRAILTDFGIAKLNTTSDPTTGTGMMGTIDFMAPEQIQSSKTVDHYADIYALGVLAYRMITGVQPFSGDSPIQILAGHLYNSVPDPRIYVADLPFHISETLERAMEKDPTKRFPTASQFVETLSRLDPTLR